jgi:hypothetical protein
MQNTCKTSAEVHLNEYLDQQQEEEVNRKMQTSQMCKSTVQDLVEVCLNIADYKHKIAADVPKHVWQTLKNAFLLGTVPLPTGSEVTHTLRTYWTMITVLLTALDDDIMSTLVITSVHTIVNGSEEGETPGCKMMATCCQILTKFACTMKATSCQFLTNFA